nr:GlsB/YeaQ/YmgE family stress response membrane protein [Micromonospora sp. DSM 115978]
MDAPTGIISALVTGLVVGALGRLVVPGRQAIGCVLTVLVGLLGAMIGLAVAEAVDAAWLLTLLLQIAVAAVLVLVVSTVTGR